MSNRMLRGLVFAAAMLVVRVFQGALINAWQTQAGWINIALLVVFTLAVVAWGVIDGRADATVNPDPDRRRDLAMTWLLASLVAGVLSGAASWLIALVYKALYVGALINELTTFAAFAALLVFLGGIVGASLGRWLIDREAPPFERRKSDEERVNTDVFAAVRPDDPATQSPAMPQEQPGTIATAEREAVSPNDSEATTEVMTPADATDATQAETTAALTETEALQPDPTVEPDDDQPKPWPGSAAQADNPQSRNRRSRRWRPGSSKSGA